MILVDTSIWIDHLRYGDPVLQSLMDGAGVLIHPLVIGELALGMLRDRRVLLEFLLELPQAIVATDDEVLQFINVQRLFGSGIGYVDAHLLAAAKLTAGLVWTRDRRLADVAKRLTLGIDPRH